MRAEQFIKDHGLERARKLLKAPIHSTHANEDYEYFSNSLDKEWCAYDDVLDVWVFEKPNTRKVVNLSELKRLMESVDLVNDLGGMQKLTPYFITTDKRLGYTHVNMAANGRICFLDDFCDFIPEQAISIKRVMEAIKAYESIYGEGNE